jgi:formylglycine-generating enzyme
MARGPILVWSLVTVYACSGSEHPSTVANGTTGVGGLGGGTGGDVSLTTGGRGGSIMGWGGEGGEVASSAGGGGDGGAAGTSATTAGGGGAGGAACTPDLSCNHVAVAASCHDGWCEIPAGCFIMGSPNNEWGRGAYGEDQAKVTLTKSFEIQQFEVTQAQWGALVLTNPSTPPLQPGNSGDCLDPSCPVGNLNWYEAAAYANLLSQAHVPPLQPCYVLSGCTGNVGEGMTCASVSMSAPSPYDCEGYRLPTAAEWEYAARAGTTTAFYSGLITQFPTTSTCEFDANLDAIGWYCMNSGSTTSTHPVGGKQPNAWGLYDMSGNAFEWTNDVTDGLGHGPCPLVDPDESNGFPPTSVLFRSCGPISIARTCRSASHFFAVQRHSKGGGYGFRLVRTLP